MRKTPVQRWSLVGVPDHQGVLNVGGRVGAAQGPRSFRKIFGRLRGRDGVAESCVDSGDLEPITQDVAENHRAASAFVRRSHSSAGLSVVIGGGHDHGFSHLAGIAAAMPKKKIACINIDAHLDVRKAEPVITSGSPFYLAIEQGVLHPSRFVEFGIQPHCNGKELWDYVEKKKVQVVEFEKLRNGKAGQAFAKALRALAAKSDAIVVSLDLDAAASAFAPGVSAPQAEGFSGSDILEMMAIAGKTKKVVSLGIFELNPSHDIDDRTARLGATAAYHFIAHALRR